MAKTTEHLVEEILDREAIRDLSARYCHYVWTNDVEGMLSIFTADGMLSIQEDDRGARVTKGADALRQFYTRLDTSNRPRPYVHNNIIELQGAGHATGVCYVELRAGSDQMNWAGTGYYHDEYVKDGGTWKFKARRFWMVQGNR